MNPILEQTKQLGKCENTFADVEVKEETDFIEDSTAYADYLLKVTKEEETETINEHTFEIKPEDIGTASYTSDNLFKIEKEELDTIEECEYHIKDEMGTHTVEESQETTLASNYEPTEPGLLQTSDGDQPKTYACGMCPFQTCLQDWLETHYHTVHNDSVELKLDKYNKSDIHRCEYCTYSTRHKSMLEKHREVKHSRRETYNCEHCDFKTMKLHCLHNHITRYKDKDETETFSCKNCSFVSKHRCSLLSHGKTHKTIQKSSVECIVYRCNDCDYVTKHKNHLEIHVLTHRSSSEVHKCRKCSFETKYENSLQLHEMNCQGDKEEAIQQTPNDSQSTKTASISSDKIVKNKPKPKRPGDVRAYKCSECEYVSNYRSNLNVHRLRHVDSSLIIIYKCLKCSFESRFKSFVKEHDRQTHAV